MRCLLFLLIGCLACGGDRSPVAQAPHPSETYWTVAEVVEPGTPLTEAMLVRAPAPWLASEAPPHLEMLVGRTPRHARLLPGEPIREKRLTRAGEAGIPGLVPQGMRAVTVPVTSVSGARPGLFADLYMGRGDEALYMPALAVLAVHPTADPDRLSTVTVSVTSLQAMDLVGVERASLGIRNPIDITYVDKHGARGTPALLGHGPEKVWVAVRDLYPGVLIAPEDVVEVGVSAQPAGLVEDPFGRIPFERILTGEPIRADRLSDPESGLGVEAVLPRGCHALWIAVDSSPGAIPAITTSGGRVSACTK